ncbi:MAG: CoA-binding protein [Dehalococcoidia bacterium]|nr:CoA-binding protein [Dehalococcoidia bacterium]
MQSGLSKKQLEQFERIFYPRSIAVAGASTDQRKMGYQWVAGLLSAGYKGVVYPVNPGGGEIMNLKIYPRLTDIPGPVDLVICCIPRTRVLGLLDDCAAKQIGAIYFFTAGFRETGDPEWIAVEEEMARRARKGSFRIIGPNCIGISCPEQGIPYGPSPLVNKIGSAGFISQSGGHAGKMAAISLTRGIGFSKVASIGNCCDLGAADFLEYMAWDPKTGMVGMYLEGPRDSARLIQVMRGATQRKPVFVWKGGRTAAGARAASSHTGALAASPSVWSGALHQAGAVEVNGLDEMADALLLYQSVGRLERANPGIICGLTDGGGGEAVLSADACAGQGIEVIPFTEKTRRELLGVLGQVGSVLVNPVDVSQRSGNLQAFEKAIEIVAADSDVDLIAVYENVDLLIAFLGRALADGMNEIVATAGGKYGKPVIVVSPPGTLDRERLEVESRFSEAGIPVFPSMERAARAIANVRQHCRMHPG